MINVSALVKVKVIMLMLFAFSPFLTSTSAYAACGGLNQKACPIFKKGPPCRTWLTKVNKICRPCGGLNQRACPIAKKGKSCKPGLKWKLGKCVKASKKKQLKVRLLQDAKQRVRRMKPLIRQIASILRRFNSKKTLRNIKSAVKSNNTVKMHRMMQDMKTRALQNALSKAGFRTMSVGVQSSAAIAGGYGRETGAAQDIYGNNRPTMYVSKTYFGGVIVGVGNDLVISAFTDGQTSINGSLYAAIGNFDVGSGVGLVLWYDKRSLMIKGISVGIGIGSVGAGGAVGHGTTYLCPSQACNRVF